MEIYNKYGAMTQQASELVSKIGKLAFMDFANSISVDVTLPKTRIIFNEFIRELNLQFAEYLLRKQVAISKLTNRKEKEKKNV